MKRRILLKKIMTMARTGDTENFENFYILTVDETYGKIAALVREPAQIEGLLTDVYVSLYHQVHTLPIEEEDLNARIEEEIYREAEKKLGLEMGEKPDIPEHYEKLNDEKAATLWMRIEELICAGREEEEEAISWKSCLKMTFRIAVALGLLSLTAVIFLKGWNYVRLSGREKVLLQAQTAVEETEVSSLVIEKEKLNPGWSQKPDRKLYYVTKDGTLADGQIAVGKQIMTFSRDGELTLIGSNREVAQNMKLSFDEEVRYEVKNGDIYRTGEDGTEECIVRNGHVVQVDIRCGFLWYVCQYRIPNTEQVKITLYRALPDGDKEEELYSSGTILETENFQVTADWYYYLSDGKLFRKSLKDGKTEFLAPEVTHYFAWEDMAYYMKDRTLETVSRGISYSGMEAGYQIERSGDSFLLLDESGNRVPQSGNGEVTVGDRIYRIEDGIIRGVRPDTRRDGNVTYYIDESSSDRKIYWKDKNGTRGLVPQEGITADCFCIAGEWLYYSARTAQYGGECQSQLYRINLRTSETEKIGSAFRGMLRNLYYFDHVQTVYGEYIPSLADPEDIHGSIVSVSGEWMRMVNDKSVRPESSGSDMLELVMATESQIYCLYHPCSYDTAAGQLVWDSAEAMEIKLP